MINNTNEIIYNCGLKNKVLKRERKWNKGKQIV